jgi:hypothetical protein
MRWTELIELTIDPVMEESQPGTDPDSIKAIFYLFWILFCTLRFQRYQIHSLL